MASEEVELVKAKEALSLARDKRVTFMRQCNTCRIANVCYAFQEDANCSLVSEVPTIKSDKLADSLLAEVIRIQTERVLQLMANLGRPTSGNATQRPEARHHSKFEEQRSRDNLEAEDAEFVPVIDMKK